MIPFVLTNCIVLKKIFFEFKISTGEHNKNFPVKHPKNILNTQIWGPDKEIKEEFSRYQKCRWHLLMKTVVVRPER